MRLPLIVRFAVSVVVVACGMLSAVHGQISETSAPRPTTLRTLTDLPKFHSYQDLREFSIDLEATVTYWDSDRRKLFVQDKKEAIYVQVTRIPDRLDFKFGDRVSVIGSMNIAEGFVDGTSVRVIDKGPISVTPISVDLLTLDKGANWSRLIVTKGELRRVVRTGLKTQLLLVAGTRKLECFVHGTDRASEFSSLIGSELSVTGVLDWETYDTGVPRMALCQVMSPSSVKTVSRSKAAESPTANQLAPLNIESLKELTLAEEGTKVHATGVVSFVDRGESFLLEDETGSVLVEYEGLELVFVGANVSIDATVGPEHRLVLERAETLEVLSRVSPILKTTARKIIGDPINYRRVSVVGTIDSWVSDGREREARLTSEGFRYRVAFNADDVAFENLDLARGSRMGCQGLVVKDADSEDAWFTVRVASLDTLVVDRGAFHIEKSKAAAWLTGLALMGLLIAAWILTMRIQVARKTKHLSGLTARLNASYGAVKEGVVVLDEEERVVSVNNQFRNVTGIKLNVGDHADRIHSELRQLFECDDLPRLIDAMTNPLSSPIEMEMQATGDNRSRIVAYLSPVEDETAREIGKLLAIEDVTKQKQLEDTLVQSQKMEAVGRLAGGVAHDFNNLLMAMNCNVELARIQIGDNSPTVSSSLSQTQIAVDRAAELVKSLLGFSRRSELQLSIGSLNDLVANVSGLIRRTFDSSIRITTDLAPDLLSCKIDPTQIEQVIMNVCLNARDAIDADGGRLEISTKNVETELGQFVRVVVKDDGDGMSEAVQQRIFEPFFTTKATGKGTGLGMSMSYGIVQQHGGTINCVSQPGVGTQFNINIPACDSVPAAPRDDATVTPRADPNCRDSSCTGKVLVVDDDDAVRRANMTLLKVIGFEAIEAHDGFSAVDLVQKQNFDLVLLDLNMPGMSGREAFGHLTAAKPDLNVAICTGYLDDREELAGNAGQVPVAFLRKPFGLDELMEACGSFLTSPANGTHRASIKPEQTTSESAGRLV